MDYGTGSLSIYFWASSSWGWVSVITLTCIIGNISWIAFAYEWSIRWYRKRFGLDNLVAIDTRNKFIGRDSLSVI
jgi:hypothetical protein